MKPMALRLQQVAHSLQLPMHLVLLQPHLVTVALQLLLGQQHQLLLVTAAAAAAVVVTAPAMAKLWFRDKKSRLMAGFFMGKCRCRWE
jgi:hypothetical protein